MPDPRPTKPRARPPGHVGAATVALTGLALACCAVAGSFGLIRLADAWMAGFLPGATQADRLMPLALPVRWVAAVLLAAGISFAVLASRGWWRRWVLLVSTIVITSVWAPVLVLAARRPEISLPWLATLCAGLGALAYAAVHRMPADEAR